jgi:hypothetical protein
MMTNKVKNIILLKQWDETKCTQQCGSKIFFRICPISFAQKFALLLYIAEKMEALEENAST